MDLGTNSEEIPFAAGLTHHYLLPNVFIDLLPGFSCYFIHFSILNKLLIIEVYVQGDAQVLSVQLDEV